MLEKHHFRVLNTCFDYIMLNYIETLFIQSQTVKISSRKSRRSSGRIINQSQFSKIFSFPHYFDDGMFQISITIEQKNIVESLFFKMHQISLLHLIFLSLFYEDENRTFQDDVKFVIDLSLSKNDFLFIYFFQPKVTT